MTRSWRSIATPSSKFELPFRVNLPHFLQLTVLVLAMAATLLLNLPEVRYVSLASVSPALVDEGVRRLGEPTISVLPSGLALIATDAVRTRGLAWPLPVVAESTAVRVRGELALADVGEGEKTWHRAILSIRTVDANAKARERTAFKGSGTRFQAVDEVILLPPETKEFQLMMRLLHVPGKFEVQDLRLDWLVERAWVPPAVLAMWVLWLLALGALLVHWLHIARFRPALVLAFAGVVVAVTLPGEWRNALFQYVTPWVNDWLLAWFDWKLPQVDGRGLSDYGHFFMFALLGAALSVARPDLPAWRLLAGLLLLGLATEVVQLLVPGREAGWLDVGFNAGGALLGVVLVRLVFRARGAGIGH